MTEAQKALLLRAAREGGDIWIEGSGQWRTVRSIKWLFDQHPEVTKYHHLNAKGWQVVTEYLLKEHDVHSGHIAHLWREIAALKTQVEALSDSKNDEFLARVGRIGVGK